METLAKLVRLPVTDTLHGLERCLQGGFRGLTLAILGLGVSWWLYVPIHELLHAAGCLGAGGSVTRLEIAPLYGGDLLARLFPFVVSGGPYAGRLSGFDTGGSDLVYLATDLAPYLLTLWPGVWLLRWAGRRGQGLLFGAALPLALAPFVSLTGDAYEIGAILLTQLPGYGGEAMRELLRSDDLVLVLGELPGSPALAWVGAFAAAALGILWALVTYDVGAALARGLGYPEVPATPPRVRRRADRA